MGEEDKRKHSFLREIGEIVILFAAACTIISQGVLPIHRDILRFFRFADVRYVMTSGLGPASVPVKWVPRRVGDPNKPPLSLVSFLVVNPGNCDHQTPIKFSINHLCMPIVDLEILPLNMPFYTLESLSGGLFRKANHIGKRSFCFKISRFPAKGIVSVSLLFEESCTPIIREDQIFVEGKEKTKRVQPANINDLFDEIWRLRIELALVSAVAIVLVIFSIFLSVKYGKARRKSYA